MNKKIDTDIVHAMLKQGFSQAEIARRLNCSSKQIGRIEKRLSIETGQTFERNTALKVPEVEKALRSFFVKVESGDQVAQRFGISRQAVFQGLH